MPNTNELLPEPETPVNFDELFDADGCFIALHPAPLYVPARSVSFLEIVAAAAGKGESALGYRIAATGEVVVNPAKSAMVSLGDTDQVLVLGPKETPAPRPDLGHVSTDSVPV